MRGSNRHAKGSDREISLALSQDEAQIRSYLLFFSQVYYEADAFHSLILFLYLVMHMQRHFFCISHDFH